MGSKIKPRQIERKPRSWVRKQMIEQKIGHVAGSTMREKKVENQLIRKPQERERSWQDEDWGD